MQRVSTWKVITAFLLDLAVSMFVFGHIIAAMDPSSTTGGSFSVSAFDVTLYGGAAVLLLVLVVGYFVVMNSTMGGTIGKHMFGIAGTRAPVGRR
jgi:uncharacterized RDD family membrane protein YckC